MKKINIKEFLEKLLIKLFKIGHVSIYMENKKFFVYIRIIKNGKTIEDEHRVFDVEGESDSPKVMKEFFKKFYDKVKYAYVSTYIDSINQGAISGCGDGVFHELGLDMSSLVKICVEDKWSVYTNIYEIDKVQEKYKAIFGVDFIFPMEIMIQHLKPEDNVDTAVLYMVNNRNSSTLTIYRHNELVYSSHFLFNDDDDSLVVADSEDDDLDESDNLLGGDDDDGLDDLDLGDDSLDDLDSMDDLDNIDDLDDFVVDDDEGDGLDSMDDDDDNVLQSEQDLKKELLLFEFVDNSLNDYYKNPNYDSDFITEAIIYDTCKCSVGLKKHIKEVFFVEPKVLTIDLGETLCNLSQLEVSGE